MLDEFKLFVEFLFGLNVPSPVVAAMVTALFAVISSFYGVKSQRIMSRDKISNENALKMIDEWLGVEWEDKRRLLIQYLVLNAPDRFDAIVDNDPAKALILRRVMNQLEKINALCIADAVDKDIIRNTLGDRITFWYVYAIEGFSADNSPNWGPIIKRLSRLKKIINKRLAKDLRNQRNAVRIAERRRREANLNPEEE